MTSMKTGLTIAGSDCSGGARIQADIKTMTTNGVYATSAITALTAQNTTGVRDILEVSPAIFKRTAGLHFYRYQTGRGEDRDGIVHRIDRGDRRIIEAIRGSTYCRGSGYGGDKRSKADPGGCNLRDAGEAF